MDFLMPQPHRLRVHPEAIRPRDRLYVHGRVGTDSVESVEAYPGRVFVDGWMLRSEDRYHVVRPAEIR